MSESHVASHQEHGVISGVSPDEAREIAKDAYIYGFPLVDSYRIQYSYHVDKSDPEYKNGWNEIYNSPRVYTPADKAVQSPNSDTPYSFIGADLRAEPLVLTMPVIDNGRYYSVQFVDMYTFNFAYVGSRSTGNKGGTFMLAGPNWKGETPTGIDAVLHCETEFATVIYRTQLFDPADIENVKKIQAGYKVQTLSAFLGKPAHQQAPTIDFIKPLDAQKERTSLDFFDTLNFVLQFCPTDPSEVKLMERFKKIGVGPGRKFDAGSFSRDQRRAVEDGVADAWRAFAEFKAQKLDTGEVGSGDVFGTRDYLQNNYLYRMAAAVIGIYGNSKDEAVYRPYFTDAGNENLDGSKRYTFRFEPGSLPQVNAFWSLTMYGLPRSLLVENAIDRYLINSTMLQDLQRDPDGGITLYLQSDSPGKECEANWLPAPDGPFLVALRCYWPCETKGIQVFTWPSPPHGPGGPHY